MDFISITELKSCHLISAQHSPVKVSYVMRKTSPLLTRNEVEEANKDGTSDAKHLPQNEVSA